jgi:hypothetical protein
VDDVDGVEDGAPLNVASVTAIRTSAADLRLLSRQATPIMQQSFKEVTVMQAFHK